MATFATLGIEYTTKTAAKAKSDMDALERAAAKLEAASERLGDAAERLGRKQTKSAEQTDKNTAAMGRMHSMAGKLVGMLGALGLAMGVRQIVAYADAWSDLQSRLGAAVKDMSAAPRYMRDMVRLANASYSPLEQTVEIFSRNVVVMQQLGFTTKETIDFTEAFNHALVITATRGERAASVQNALAKAMAVGKLGGEGLETVLANAGEVAERLATALGTNVNGLRAMATQGRITSEVIVRALAGNLEELRAKAEEMPATVADAFVRLRNNLTAFIGQTDKGIGASQVLAQAIFFLANNIDLINQGLLVLAASRLPALVTWLYATVTAARAAGAAFLTMNAAMGLIAAAAAGIALLLYNASQDTATLTKSINDLNAAQQSLTTTTEEFFRVHSIGSAKALKAAGELAKAQAEAALITAKEELARARSLDNIFHLGLRESERTKAARKLVEDLSRAWIDAVGTISLAEHAISNFNTEATKAGAGLDKAGDSFAKLGNLSRQALPAMSDLRREFGVYAESVRKTIKAQNDLADAMKRQDMANVAAEAAKLAEKLGLTVDEADAFKALIDEITTGDKFGSMAFRSKELADWILQASGGLEKMDAETAKVYHGLLQSAREGFKLAESTRQVKQNAWETLQYQLGLRQTALGYVEALATSSKNGAGLARALSVALDVAAALLNALASIAETLSKFGGAIGTLASTIPGIGKGLGPLAQVAGNVVNVFGGEKIVKGLRQTASLLDGVAGAARAAANSVGKGKGGGGGKSMADALTEAQKKAIEFANTFRQTLGNAVDSAIDWMLSGFKGGFDGLLDIAKQTIKDLIKLFIANPIKVALGLSPIPMTAAGAAQAAGGIWGFGGSMAQAATGGKGGGGLLGGLLGASMSKVGSGLASVFNGGFGLSGIAAGFKASFANLGSLLSGSGGLATLGAAIPAIGLVLVGITAFIGKTKLLNEGLRVTVRNLDAFAERFSTTETKYVFGLFSSGKKTRYSAADAATQDVIGSVISELQRSVMDSAKVLGVGADAFNGFYKQLSISTKGLSEEAAQQKIKDALEGLADEFAALALKGYEVSKAGEGAATTLSRLASALQAMNAAADILGSRMFSASIMEGHLASIAVDAAGGIEAFGQAAEVVWAGYYTAEERLQTRTRQLTKAFDDLGFALPQTREQFRALLLSIDTTTESGAALYGQLLALGAVLTEILPEVQNLSLALSQLLGETVTGLENAIQAITEAATANRKAAADWYKAAASIRSYIDKMRGTAGVLTNPEQARAYNEARYQATLARAMAGDLAAANELTNVADLLIQSSRATARTREEAALVEARILSDLGLMAGVSDIEGARHDVIAGLLDRQVEILTEARDYIQAGNAMTAAQLAKLSKDLGSLDEAIAAAELINYAYLNDRLAVTVDVIADAAVPDHLKKLLANAATGVTGFIDFIVRSDLTPDLKWLALEKSSQHLKTIEYLAKNNLGEALTKVAIDKIGSYQVNVSTAFGAGVQDMLKVITGSKDGKITLGGSFVFDPSSGFKTWYETSTQTQIAKPMDAARAALGTLNTTIQALTKQMELEAKARAEATKQDAERAKARLIQDWANANLISDGKGGYVATSASQLQSIAAQLGLDPKTAAATLANQIAAASGLDNVNKIVMDSAALRQRMYAQIDNPNLKVNAAEYLRIRPDLKGDRLYDGRPQAHWEDYGRREMKRDNFSWFSPAMFDWASVGLSFAGGGYTGDGIRAGGLDGQGGFMAMMHPQETVIDHTRDGSFGDIVAEIRALRAETAATNARLERIEVWNRKTADSTEKAAKDTRKIATIGYGSEA